MCLADNARRARVTSTSSCAAVFGLLLSPMIAALAMSFSSVSVSSAPAGYP